MFACGMLMGMSLQMRIRLCFLIRVRVRVRVGNGIWNGNGVGVEIGVTIAFDRTVDVAEGLVDVGLLLGLRSGSRAVERGVLGTVWDGDVDLETIGQIALECL